MPGTAYLTRKTLTLSRPATDAISVPYFLMRVLLSAAFLFPAFFGTLSNCVAQEVSFQRDIRPLLSDRCFKCHGFDDETREADLGLHLFEQATRDLGGYQAIKPGDAAASEVIERLISDDPDEVMPPPCRRPSRTNPAFPPPKSR